MNREVEIDRFVVRSKDGTEFIVMEYQEYVSIANQEHPHAEKKGLKRLATSNGIPVNPIDTHTFYIGDSGVIAHKIRR